MKCDVTQVGGAGSKMEAHAALCWLVLAESVAVMAGPVWPWGGAVTTGSYDGGPSGTLFFDYADNDKNKTAAISAIIGEPAEADISVQISLVLRMILLGSLLLLILFIIYHILCRRFCMFGV